MCRNRKIQALLLGIVMMTSLAGCGLSGKLMTDTGSGNQKEIAREDYLQTNVLKEQSQTVDDMYEVVTLAKGTYEEDALAQNLKRSYINVPTVRLSVDGIPARFGEYLVDDMQYVEVGDVIATVHTDVDEIAIEEAKMKLQRLQERYQEAEAQLNKDIQELTEEYVYGYKVEIHQRGIQQKQRDWEYEKYNFESKIKAAKKEIDKLTEVGAIYEVKATTEGYVTYNRRYVAGDKLKDDDYICHIMNSSAVYVVTELQAEQYCYGMEVTFDSRNGVTPATVVNGGSQMLYGNLDTARAIFRLEFEQDVAELDKAMLNNLMLKGKLKTIENVVLVPKKAVTAENGEYFVTVLKEDGTLLKTEFIPGGNNGENYWVLDGLTEGTQIIMN